MPNSDQDRSIFLELPSQAMKNVYAQIDAAARLTNCVLLLGETGVGKEGIARRLHDRSARASGPFVKVNAGKFDPERIENELFGHVRGAFTGSVANRQGLLKRAHTGTLFLDEIGELACDLQVHLLRVLEEQLVRPQGSDAEARIDVRFVAATNRDLAAAMDRFNAAESKGQPIPTRAFRPDLYARLDGKTIRIPPLSDRPDDVAFLATAFAMREARKLGVSQPVFMPDALRALREHSWQPGNTRTLRSVIENAVTDAGGAEIRLQHLHLDGRRSPSPVERAELVTAALNACGMSDKSAEVTRHLSALRTTVTDGSNEEVLIAKRELLALFSALWKHSEARPYLKRTREDWWGSQTWLKVYELLWTSWVVELPFDFLERSWSVERIARLFSEAPPTSFEKFALHPPISPRLQLSDEQQKVFDTVMLASEKVNILELALGGPSTAVIEALKGAPKVTVIENGTVADLADEIAAAKESGAERIVIEGASCDSDKAYKELAGKLDRLARNGPKLIFWGVRFHGYGGDGVFQGSRRQFFPLEHAGLAWSAENHLLPPCCVRVLEAAVRTSAVTEPLACMRALVGLGLLEQGTDSYGLTAAGQGWLRERASR
jgi:transcriptional regulator with AAA-type ATPase domain